MFLYDLFSNFLNFVLVPVYEALLAIFRRVSSLLTLTPTHLIEEYESKYGSVHPKIFLGSFEEARRVSLHSGKMIVLYIHSEFNDHVCRNLFTNQLIIEDTNYIFYVEYYKGASMRKMMNLVNSLTVPHVSVLSFQGLNRCTVVNRLEGSVEHDSLVSMLLGSVEYQPPLERVESSRQVIREQDEEFRRAVEIDSVKFKERDIKRRDEAQRRKTQELIKRQKKEERGKILEHRKELAKMYANLNERIDRKGVKIRVRLPTGNSIEGEFAKNDKVEKIYEWVEASQFLENKNYKIPYNFNLSIPYPSTTLSDRNITLENANLVPSSSLLLTSLDDTSEED
uniref:Ubiquitin regulatory protein, putative n=1 Tax=Theileria annulata TaxID=5874 RepID=A0A3B0MTF1_THEAN